MYLVDGRDFYRDYRANHFIYKQTLLHTLIQQQDVLPGQILADMEDYNPTDFVRMLRLELRFTLFQMIETLFELFFALRGGNDRHIWRKLVKSNAGRNFKKIEGIARETNQCLYEMIPTGWAGDMPFVQYVFYFNNTTGNDSEMRSFVDAIREILKVLASEFADREQYNAYKHAFRVLATLASMQITNNTTGKTLTRDLTNSFTYLVTDEGSNDSSTFHTKNLDSERDYKLSRLCYHLIRNLIDSRIRTFFGEEEVQIAAFDLAACEMVSKRNIDLFSVKVTVTFPQQSTSDTV